LSQKLASKRKVYKPVSVNFYNAETQNQLPYKGIQGFDLQYQGRSDRSFNSISVFSLGSGNEILTSDNT
jgi:hypothetical protein